MHHSISYGHAPTSHHLVLTTGNYQYNLDISSGKYQYRLLPLKCTFAVANREHTLGANMKSPTGTQRFESRYGGSQPAKQIGRICT